MKSLLSLLALSAFSLFSNGQNCMDLGNYTIPYISAVSSDHVTYPPGTAFMTTGNIQYVKPNITSYYQDIQGDSLFYIGDIDIDVSLEVCANKELIFSCAYLEGLAVDGDTIFSQLNPPAFYQGAGFTFEHVGTYDYVVTGDFDIVNLFSQTNFLYDVCLECDAPFTGQECVSLANYDVNYLNDVSTDDVTYPVGDPFITSGNIQYVKPNLGNYYQGIQGDSLFYIGDLDIDVSLHTCPNKELVFSCAYLEGVAVDGDTVFNSLNPPAFYQGAGFTFEHLGGYDYVVTGDFDVVSLYSSTNFLYDVCLDCAPEVISSECVSLAAYDNTHLNAVSNDDVTYPVGDPFITSGNIQYVKPGLGNYYQGIQGDSLFYIGDIDIDVSTLICSNKVLYFSCAYLEGVAVDGDTIFASLNPPAFYQGAGFTFEHLGGYDYMVTGDFDVVSLYSSTNFLYDVCLECLSTSSIDDVEAVESILIYPNPSSGIFNIQSDFGSFNYQIITMEGKVISSGRSLNGYELIDISNHESGFYFVKVTSENGFVNVEKVQIVQ